MPTDKRSPAAYAKLKQCANDITEPAMTITIELPDHLLEYIQTKITAGPYTTISEYIQALIEQDMAQHDRHPPTLN
jgi:predicted DNA binding CopG/RHH family protein